MELVVELTRTQVDHAESKDGQVWVRGRDKVKHQIDDGWLSEQMPDFCPETEVSKSNTDHAG